MQLLRILTEAIFRIISGRPSAVQVERNTDNLIAQRMREISQRVEGDSPILRLIFPDRPDCTFTYPKLIEMAGAWTQAYRAAGLLPGNCVIVVLTHSEALYGAYIGALLGGFRPTFLAHPSEKVAQDAYIESLLALRAQLDTHFLVTSSSVVDYIGDAASSFCGLLDTGASFGMLKKPNGADTDAQDIAFYQFSSGTTGVKKCVAVSSSALIEQVDDYAQAIQLTSSDKIVSWLPLYHDMGLIACFFVPLLRGVPLVAMSPFHWVSEPGILFDAISQHRGTLVWLPNFAYNFLANRAKAAGKVWDLSSVRGFVNCSEPILASSHNIFFEAFKAIGVRKEALMTCYAMAENTFAVTSSLPGTPAVNELVHSSGLQQGQIVSMAAAEASNTRTVVSSGRVLPSATVEILDVAGEPTLEEGFLGEIAVRSACLFSGYYRNKSATVAVLKDDRYKTGDLGYLRNGELFVVGRIKDTIICAGKNIYPQDIEHVVNGVDGVIPGRCVAFGVDLPEEGTQGLVVVAESSTVASKALAAAIRSEIVAHADLVVHAVSIVEEGWLLKSTSGKISRAANHEKYLATHQRPIQQIPNPELLSDSLIDKVLVALEKLIDREATPFDIDTDFISEGLIDSFSQVELILELERVFGTEVVRRNRVVLRSSRTAAQIAKALGAPNPEPSSKVVRASASLPQGAGRKYQLVPQMRDVEAQPYEWVAYLMRRGMAGYVSASLNTDEHGFRITHRLGRQLLHQELHAAKEVRHAIVLGNSLAYGAGVTGDAKTFASLLNEDERAGAFTWRNLSLRASVFTQERLAFELYGPDTASVVLWVSGINSLIALIVGEGYAGNPAPFVGERAYTSAMMPNRLQKQGPGVGAGYAGMLRQAERDISALALQVTARGGRLLFGLQPSLSWIEKPLSDEEQYLVAQFDRAGSPVQAAHHPQVLRPLYARYAADLRSICERWGVSYLDMNQIPDMGSPNWLFVDRTHMTDVGHAIIAKAVSRWLGELGVTKIG